MKKIKSITTTESLLPHNTHWLSWPGLSPWCSLRGPAAPSCRKWWAGWCVLRYLSTPHTAIVIRKVKNRRLMETMWLVLRKKEEKGESILEWTAPRGMIGESVFSLIFRSCGYFIFPSINVTDFPFISSPLILTWLALSLFCKTIKISCLDEWASLTFISVGM